MASSEDYVAVEKLRYALKVKQVNDELLEQLASSLRWLLHYSEKNGIPLPEKDKIIALIDRAIEIESRLPTNLNNQRKHPDNEQELKLSVVESQGVENRCSFSVG